MWKRLLSKAWAQEIVAAIAAFYLTLAKRTIRWTVRNGHYADPLYASDQGLIGVVWHGRIIMGIEGWDLRRKKAMVLASTSREGEIGKRVARWYGVDVARGSSYNPLKPEKDKKGQQGYRKMMRHIESGGLGAITPDGPRGPRMRCGTGSVRLARDTGAPLLPFSYSTDRHTILSKSWDHHLLPHLFSRGVIVWGEPIYVPSDADEDAVETYRQKLEDTLNAITAEADIACGVEPMQPGPKRVLRKYIPDAEPGSGPESEAV